jgi:D-alanyl-D-alanine carboxypeptidase
LEKQVVCFYEGVKIGKNNGIFGLSKTCTMKGKILWLLIFMLGENTYAQTALQQVDALMQSHFKTNEPGAGICIVQQGKVIFKQGYGVTSLEHPATLSSTTNFNIASLTKQFTAVAILQLADKNRLSLSDPVSKYFPELNAVTSNRVSIFHLLTHSSGLQDHYNYTDTKNMQHANDHDVLKAVTKTDSLYFTPGSSYRYSNTAFCLLALIIEKVSGLPYAEYIKQNIFTPLGMTHSSVLDTTQPLYNAATGYQWDSAKNSFMQSDANENIFFSTQGDGGIYTSLDDYLKWFTALQKGTVLSPALIKQARSIQHIIDPANQLGYGFGWFVGAKEQPAVVYHTGSNGGFRSIVVTIPTDNYALVIFCNRTGVDLEKLAKEINKILRITNKSLQRIESLISFQDCWPIFAPCKKTPQFLTFCKKNWNANVMVLN